MSSLPAASASPVAPPPSGAAADAQSAKGVVVWLTGLSGSGKTTLSRALRAALVAHGHRVCLLDGDELRTGLNSDLGFSAEDREENIRRAAEVARILSAAGLVTIMALISPRQSHRRFARERIVSAGGAFVQIWLSAPLEVCEARDVKGLYQRARRGEIAEFTGISSPYDAPTQSELVIDTQSQSLDQSVATVLEYLRPLLPLPG